MKYYYISSTSYEKGDVREYEATIGMTNEFISEFYDDEQGSLSGVDTYTDITDVKKKLLEMASSGTLTYNFTEDVAKEDRKYLETLV